MKGRRRGRSNNNAEIIGIIGVVSEDEATHLGCAIANYLCSVEKMEVLYIEAGQVSNLYNLLKNKWLWKGQDLLYCYKGVSYLLAVTSNKIREILSNRSDELLAEVDIIIVDLGTTYIGNEEIIKMCSRMIIIGNLMPWNVKTYLDFALHLEKIYKDIGCLERYSYNLTRDQKMLWYKETENKIYNIPILGDPYNMKKQDVDVINSLVRGS